MIFLYNSNNFGAYNIESVPILLFTALEWVLKRRGVSPWECLY
jgi:hypothetical protein